MPVDPVLVEVDRGHAVHLRQGERQQVGEVGAVVEAEPRRLDGTRQLGGREAQGGAVALRGAGVVADGIGVSPVHRVGVLVVLVELETGRHVEDVLQGDAIPRRDRRQLRDVGRPSAASGRAGPRRARCRSPSWSGSSSTSGRCAGRTRSGRCDRSRRRAGRPGARRARRCRAGGRGTGRRSSPRPVSGSVNSSAPTSSAGPRGMGVEVPPGSSTAEGIRSAAVIWPRGRFQGWSQVVASYPICDSCSGEPEAGTRSTMASSLLSTSPSRTPGGPSPIGPFRPDPSRIVGIRCRHAHCRLDQWASLTL